jgi:hypothetical protein
MMDRQSISQMVPATGHPGSSRQHRHRSGNGAARGIRSASPRVWTRTPRQVIPAGAIPARVGGREQRLAIDQSRRAPRARSGRRAVASAAEVAGYSSVAMADRGSELS